MTRPAGGLKTALFDGLSDEEIDHFFQLALRQGFRSGEVIIAEGDPGDGIFVVASGKVRVEKATIDQRQEVLAMLGSGECFGELSLVDRKPRSATVRASGETEVFVFAQARVEAFFQAHTDIHRKLLENLAKITSQRLRWLDDTLVQSVYDNVILVDRSCYVLQWKHQAKVLETPGGAVAPEEAAGRDLFELAPGLGEGVRQKVMQVVASGEMTVLPLEYEPAPGRKSYFEITVAPYVEEDQTVGAVLALRDVTETRSLEMQLIQAEKLAMAGQMSAEIGHELNNYLAVISGHTDLLMDHSGLQDNPRASKSLRAISDQLRKVERFTAGLMDLGMLQSQQETADLNKLIDKLVQFIQGQSRFRQIEFVMDLDKNLPLAEVDPGQVQQVLLNLYANAADAMGRGRVVTTTRFEADVNRVVVCVADTGPGMSAEVRARIFESGFTTKTTGHGFGLSVCVRIVQNHQGTIQVESEQGRGTTFTLTFQA